MYINVYERAACASVHYRKRGRHPDPPTQETEGPTGLPQGTLRKVPPASPLVRRCPARKPCVPPTIPRGPLCSVPLAPGPHCVQHLAAATSKGPGNKPPKGRTCRSGTNI